MFVSLKFVVKISIDLGDSLIFNLHRYRAVSMHKNNRMLQGTFMPSYRPVLKMQRMVSLLSYQLY